LNTSTLKPEDFNAFFNNEVISHSSSTNKTFFFLLLDDDKRDVYPLTVSLIMVILSEFYLYV
jgi:hypothetical protein